MSLFGDDADTPTTPRGKSSLFDNGNQAERARPNAGMFGDDEPPAADSPWGFTPRKSAGLGAVVKSLLANAAIPDAYIDLFDQVQVGGQVNEKQCRDIFSQCSLEGVIQDKIWRIASSNESTRSLGRAEFNVLAALIGLAQEGEDLSLDSVDERRDRLPTLKLSVATSAGSTGVPSTPKAQVRPASGMVSNTPRQNGQPRKPSFGAGFGESDPWASPELHSGHAHTNGTSNSVSQRATSTFSSSGLPAESESRNSGGGQAGGFHQATSWNASGDFGAAGSNGFRDMASGGDGGFGSGAAGDSGPPAPIRSTPSRGMVSTGQEEVVTVKLLDEKEGMFMFQHRNYEVASVRRASKVIRRYSDFVWLLDCLHKRYPFRQLPLLPPKRVAINGNHIAADMTFLEKRRRGLVRFANTLVRHPVLREEQLVVMFLTVPTELSVWRKQATLNVQEEFVGKPLPPTLEASLPPDLQDTADTVRAGVRRSSELYINLCNLTERLCKRKEAIASEYGRFGTCLTALTETSAETYAIDTNDVPLLNEGINATAKHMHTSRTLLDDEARAWDEGLLEDMKSMRDSLVSLRDMFERRDRYARDNIPQLEKKIQQNEQKLQGIKAKGPAAKPGEAEKVEAAIVSDKQSIVDQHARGIFIKECVRDEIVFFQTTIARASRLHQDWAQERVKYAELQADNFRALVDAVESMPLGD